MPDLHAYQLDGAHTHTHICTRSHEGKLIFTLNALLTYASVFAVVVVVFMFFICWCIFSAFLQNFNAVRRTCLSSCTSWLAQSSSAASTATTATPTITPQRLRCVASSIAPPGSHLRRLGSGSRCLFADCLTQSLLAPTCGRHFCRFFVSYA